MGALGYLVVGFAPGLFVLFAIVRRSRHRPEPRSLVVRTFVLGVAVAIPILFVDRLVLGPDASGPSDGPMSTLSAAFYAFVVAGLIEELGKMLVVRTTLVGTPYLDDPLRGMVFSSAAALGFASIENVMYMLSFGPAVIFARAVSATVGHVVFSAFWGAALGYAHRRDTMAAIAMLVGLLGAVVAHGLYDFFLFTDRAPLGLLTFVVTVALFLALFGAARRASLSMHGTSAARATCHRCRTTTSVDSTFCPGCGGRLDERAQRQCVRCDAVIPTGADFCPKCGAHARAS